MGRTAPLRGRTESARLLSNGERKDLCRQGVLGEMQGLEILSLIKVHPDTPTASL